MFFLRNLVPASRNSQLGDQLIHVFPLYLIEDVAAN
jgi:hypothetical protein